MSTMFNPVGYNPNSHHTIFQHNELSILVDFDEISDQINQLQADLVEEPAKKAVLDAFIHLEKIIKNLASSHMDRLWECIPLRKDGKFEKGKTILLYDSGVKPTVVYDTYQVFSSIQIRLIPYFAHLQDYLTNTPVENSRKMVIDIFSNQNLTPPVLDQNGVPQETKRVKNKYLDSADMIPGRVYLDAKQTQWLYLGVIFEEEEPLIKNSTNCIFCPSVAYLKLTKKAQALTKKYNDIPSLVRALMEKNFNKNEYLLTGVSTSWNEKKMIAEDHILYPVPTGKIVFPYPPDSYWGQKLKCFSLEFQPQNVAKTFFHPVEVIVQRDPLKVVEKKFYNKNKSFPPEDNATNIFIRSVMEKCGFKCIGLCTYEKPNDFSYDRFESILRINGISIHSFSNLKK